MTKRAEVPAGLGSPRGHQPSEPALLAGPATSTDADRELCRLTVSGGGGVLEPLLSVTVCPANRTTWEVVVPASL